MPTPKPSRKSRPAPPKSSSAFARAMEDLRQQPQASFEPVSPRWLLKAVAIVGVGALLCAWLTLCLLYWQGSWQLLYHPSTKITETPANAELTFESVHFAATETGIPQLTGWYIPAEGSQRTILYLHGADGNLSDAVDALKVLHRQNLAIFAIDYRGYGQSQPAQPHPTEKQLRQDAEWALTWLTLTRNIPAKRVVVYGIGLGATLASELAADHPELAGVILDQPQQDALAPVFADSRSRLVPARLLIHDRYDLTAASQSLKIPSLWLLAQTAANQPGTAPTNYREVQVSKTIAWLNPPVLNDAHFAETLRRWLDDL